ncbi:hypothetical protein [Microseira wollei]|uniref:hypothetical protein n=1 Tax=Microseira wollei TaxID=467598 RepID=UPI001CFF4267|nr:hypothetical protein [Microseira wollei]
MNFFAQASKNSIQIFSAPIACSYPASPTPASQYFPLVWHSHFQSHPTKNKSLLDLTAKVLYIFVFTSALGAFAPVLGECSKDPCTCGKRGIYAWGLLMPSSLVEAGSKRQIKRNA